MLIKSVNYWSFPGGLEGTLDPVEALHLAMALGFEGVELAVGPAGSALGLDCSDARLDEIVATAKELGLSLASLASGLYWERNLASADSSLRAQAVDDLKRMVAIASRLGAKTLLTIPGAVDVFFLPDRPRQAYAEVLQYAKEGLLQVLPDAASHEVRLGIENVWNKFLLSPAEMADFVDSFGSPWIGAYLDVGNVLPFGYPQDWLRHLGLRVVGVHFKDFRRSVGTADGFVDLLEGDVDWPDVTAALEEIGYDGPVAAEMIPGYRHHPMVRVENASRAMDAILGRG
ncbi:MAG: sugar phosphate isomerase/epimerase family protein [Fimbriimonadaceae bacterium]